MANYRSLLDPTTLEAWSESFSPVNNNTATIVACGLAGAETVTLQIRNPFKAVGDADEYQDCPQSIITATTNPYGDDFLSAGTFRFYKTATASAVGIALIQNNKTGV